jgi:selenocysteine lyase/cysteine desulfurase
VDDFLVFYSSVHRGTGFKSQLSTHAYERARHITLDFVGADPNEHTCIFGKNTTEAVNKLARRFPFTAQRDVVLTSGMEHHSNDLPWRTAAHTVHVALTPDGRLDEVDFDTQLERYGERVALVAITGASNVTGFLNPVHRLAEKTHAAGAMIMVDCAQLAPHRKVDMRRLADPAHYDFITVSAHKMYAPFGTGALIGRKDIFSQGDPDVTGGGTVEIVTLEDVIYTTPPDRDEAGSPNTVGAIALAGAIRQLEAVGMDQVAQHEAELTEYALRRLPSVPGLRLYGDSNPAHASQRLGVIPLMLESVPHFLASAILGYEFGIGVRSGCFCAHPYILHLLGLSHAESRQVRSDMLAGDKSHMPGLIRASFGLYNTLEEIDYLVEALNRITRGEYKGRYNQEKATGEYQPVGWAPQFEEYFNL